MSKNLFDEESDDGDYNTKFSTNTDYAKNYNKFREKEFLKKLKDQNLDGDSDSSSDTDTSSDDDEVVDAKFDKDFFKTLSSLKNKDPVIYDKSTTFFKNLDDDDDNAEQEKEKSKKDKPMTLKDYERKVIVEREGKFEDDSDSETETYNLRSQSPTLAEEERQLKAEFKNVLNANESDGDNDDDDDGNGFGGIFKKREKKQEERDEEEQNYVEWLAGKEKELKGDIKETLEPLKKYWNNEKLPPSERFLRDYILNKGYKESNTTDVPTYDDIVNDTVEFSDDEKELEKQADFEHQYNFRFEEPNSEFITRYPRTIENSVRRTDDKRKVKRQELKERKQQEKEQKLKDIEMLKEIKRKEIKDKIEKLKAVTGNDELGLNYEELDEDFDPDAHDRRMKELFNDDYYQVDEGDEKPECPSDIDELKVEDWDNYNPDNFNNDNDYEPHCEEDDFNMDCEYDPTASKEQMQQELIENTRKRKNRRGRRNRFMEMIQTEKPAFNPDDEQTYGEYIDEFYKLDCEDVIDDIPCRFKYSETIPNDFGLSIEEILLAKNKELNQWCSLKKTMQIRPDHLEKKDQRMYKLKSKNDDLKRKIFKSIYGEDSDNEDEDEVEKDNTTPSTTENAESNDKKKKKKRKRKSNAVKTTNDNSVTTENGPPSKLPKIETETTNLLTKKSTSTTNNQNPFNRTGNQILNSEISKEKFQPSAGKSKSNKQSQNRNKNSASTNNKNPYKRNGMNNNNKFKSNNTNKESTMRTKGNRFKGQKSNQSKDAVNISDERLQAYGINPRKLRKEKYANKSSN